MGMSKRKRTLLSHGSIFFAAVLAVLVSGCATGQSRTKVPSYDILTQVQEQSTNHVDSAFMPQGDLKLHELIEFAESNSPDLRSIYRKWEAAKETAPQAASLPDPRLTYGYFTEEVQTRTGPQKQRVGVSQTFPWFGKLPLQEKMAIKDAEAAFQDYIASRLKLAERIRSDYHEYAYLAHAIAITREHLELLEVMESVAVLRFKYGTLSQNILIQIQVEQGKREDQVEELEALRLPLSSNIYASLGLKGAGILPWPKQKAIPIPSIDRKKLRSSLLESNPSLRRIDLLEKKAAYSVKLAEKMYYPDITLGVERTDIDGGDDPTLASISINLPIWRGRLDAAKNEALKRRESLRHASIDKGNQLSAQLDLVIYYFRDAGRKTRLYRDTLIPKAQQAIDIALKGFETGSVSFSDLLDSERSLLEFQLIGKRQLADAHKRLAEIEALIGRDVLSNKTIN